MNPQTYTQMLALQQQRGMPVTSKGPVQQTAPAVPAYDANNPLSEGSMAAINAARQSLAGQRHKKIGFIDNLLRMAESASVARLRNSRSLNAQALGSAMKTPEEEDEFNRAREAEIANENFKMMQFLNANEQMKQQQAYKMAMLEEQRRAHNMMAPQHAAHADYYRAMAENARKNPGSYGVGEDLPEWGYSLKGMSPSEKNLIRKDMLERAHKPNEMKKARETLKEMREIAHKFPHLSKSFATALSPEDAGGILNTTKRMFMSKEDNDAIAKFKKLRSDLVLHNTKALGGTRANMFLEKMIKEASPDYGMTPDVVDYMAEHFDNVYFNPVMQDAKNARAAIKGHFGALKPQIEDDVYETKLSDEEPMVSGPASRISDEDKIKMARERGLID